MLCRVQNRYWGMYSSLFVQQNCLGCKGVITTSAMAELNTSKIQTCMKLMTTLSLIDTNRSEAALHNISATPTFVIGPIQSDGSLDEHVIEGALPLASFQ